MCVCVGRGCRGRRAKPGGSRVGGGEEPKRRRRRRIVLRNLGQQYNTILYVYKNCIIRVVVPYTYLPIYIYIYSGVLVRGGGGPLTWRAPLIIYIIYSQRPSALSVNFFFTFYSFHSATASSVLCPVSWQFLFYNDGGGGSRAYTPITLYATAAIYAY